MHRLLVLNLPHLSLILSLNPHLLFQFPTHHFGFRPTRTPPWDLCWNLSTKPDWIRAKCQNCSEYRRASRYRWEECRINADEWLLRSRNGISHNLYSPSVSEFQDQSLCSRQTQWGLVRCFCRKRATSNLSNIITFCVLSWTMLCNYRLGSFLFGQIQQSGQE